MAKPRAPMEVLIAHLGIPAAQVAREADISTASVSQLRRGMRCGAHLWRRISARYALEIRQAGLTVEDFLAGEILTGQPPGIERRQA